MSRTPAEPALPRPSPLLYYLSTFKYILVQTVFPESDGRLCSDTANGSASRGTHAAEST